MTAAKVVLEKRTQRSEDIDHYALMVDRLNVQLQLAVCDAQRLHLCAVADAIMAARVELKKSAKQRLGVDT